MIDLQQAVVYDIETLPNAFTMNVVGLFDDSDMTFEISEFRDDRALLFAWFDYWADRQTPMVGFNNLGFDYTVLHFLYYNQNASVGDIYEQAQSLIRSSFGGRSFNMVWESDRFAPQIDLFKIFHFDNPAKATSLKALQVSMRSERVVEMPLPFDQPVSESDLRSVVIPYNKHDVRETKRFALMNLDAINFRIGLQETLRGDVLNFSDSKIGSKLLEQRLGDDLCYERDPTGRRQPRQTFRTSIALDEIIFPYIKFTHPEFVRILSWMRTQTLTADEWGDTIRTKGVFTGVHAHVGGIDFHFGTGGIHGSVNAQRLASDAQWVIRDIDVAGLYPAIAIVNRLHPEHLGQRFVEEYARLPLERKEWQKKKGKKCVEANSLKLAGNGTYGNSNNAYSVFYDPRFTMSITINGQLLLCMLAEWLLGVPTLQIIQINTDGVTYRVRRELVSYAQRIQRMWEDYTHLVLEEVDYSRMWIRDVNNYVAEPANGDPLKQKGAYWFARKFPDDIAQSQPPAWHKDFSAVVSVKAAVEHMVTGKPIADFVRGCGDPFDFMCRAKCDRSSKLMIDDRETQRIMRYFVSTNGGSLRKVSPPAKGHRVGEWKRAPKVTDSDYYAIKREVGDAWDPRIHTKSKSKYEIRETSIESGYKVTDCSDAAQFDFESVNYDWYIEQAQKLVIA